MSFYIFITRDRAARYNPLRRSSSDLVSGRQVRFLMEAIA
ncbi:hypothetical protein BN136_216 [Cronobacter universalis NCTC 9529]|nr:hypothetical protein BN136_216 [Cronobacter universalis NCTC 9529]